MTRPVARATYRRESELTSEMVSHYILNRSICRDDMVPPIVEPKSLTVAQNLTRKVAAWLRMDPSEVEADWLDTSADIYSWIDRLPTYNYTKLGIRRYIEELADYKLEMDEREVDKTITRLVVARIGIPMEMKFMVRDMYLGPGKFTECVNTGHLYFQDNWGTICRCTPLWIQNDELHEPQLNTYRGFEDRLIFKLMVVEEQYLYIVWRYFEHHDAVSEPGKPEHHSNKGLCISKYNLRHLETSTDGSRHLERMTNVVLDYSDYSDDYFGALMAVNVDPSNTGQQLIYILNSTRLVLRAYTLDGDIRRSINLTWPGDQGLENTDGSGRRISISNFSVNSRGEIIIATMTKYTDEWSLYHLFNVNGEYEREIVTGPGPRPVNFYTFIYVDRRDYLYVIREVKLDHRDMSLRIIDIMDSNYKLVGRIRLPDYVEPDTLILYQIELVERNGDIVLNKFNGMTSTLYILENPVYKNLQVAEAAAGPAASV